MLRLKANILMPQMVQRAHEKPRPAQQQNTESNLNANSNFAEKLRAFARRSCALSQSVGQLGPHKMHYWSDAEEQTYRQPKRKRKQQHARVDGRRIRLGAGIGMGQDS